MTITLPHFSAFAGRAIDGQGRLLTVTNGAFLSNQAVAPPQGPVSGQGSGGGLYIGAGAGVTLSKSSKVLFNFASTGDDDILASTPRVEQDVIPAVQEMTMSTSSIARSVARVMAERFGVAMVVIAGVLRAGRVGFQTARPAPEDRRDGSPPVGIVAHVEVTTIGIRERGVCPFAAISSTAPRVPRSTEMTYREWRLHLIHGRHATRCGRMRVVCGERDGGANEAHRGTNSRWWHDDIAEVASGDVPGGGMRHDIVAEPSSGAARAK